MNRVRFAGAGYKLRLAGLQAQKNVPGFVPGPGADCTGNPLGERLGIAALYAGHGDDDNARAAALLALAGVSDSPEHRAGIASAFDQVAQLVRVAAFNADQGAFA